MIEAPLMERGSMLANARVVPTLAVSDIERARQFYERKLGFEAEVVVEGTVRYGCGGATALAIFERPMEAIDRTGASSGAVAELELAQIARVDNYLDREKALEAAGLSEWAMSRKRRSSSRRGPPPGRIGPQPRFGTK